MQDIEVQEISDLLNNFKIPSPNSTMDQLAELQAEQSTLADDITDFIDENDLEDNINDIEDIDSCICRIKKL